MKMITFDNRTTNKLLCGRRDPATEGASRDTLGGDFFVSEPVTVAVASRQSTDVCLEAAMSSSLVEAVRAVQTVRPPVYCCDLLPPLLSHPPTLAEFNDRVRDR